MDEITQVQTHLLALSQTDIKKSALPGSYLWHEKGYNSLTRVLQQTRQGGRNGEKMYSVTNRRCFRRHECPCKCPCRYSHAFGLSFPNRLENAQAFGLSYIRALQKRKTKPRSFEISPVWQLLSAAHHPVHRVTRPLHNLPFEMQSLHCRDDCTELLWKVSFSFPVVQTSIIL